MSSEASSRGRTRWSTWRGSTRLGLVTLTPTLTLTLTLTKVEHVARLNERGNRLLLLPEPTEPELRQARPRLEWGLQPNYCNPVCSLP